MYACMYVMLQCYNTLEIIGFVEELIVESDPEYQVCCVALYCIVLYCIVLYCIVLYCIVLYCIVLYCIELHGILLDVLDCIFLA